MGFSSSSNSQSVVTPSGQSQDTAVSSLIVFKREKKSVCDVVFVPLASFFDLGFDLRFISTASP